MKPVVDHYAVLGVAPDADSDELRAAWRFAIEAFHPDRYPAPGQRERAHDMAARVNAAWDVLGDPARRRDYDIQRRRGSHEADGPAMRELPCPHCLARCGVPDQRGRATTVRCPSCGEGFPAHVGATLLGKPQLVWKGLRAHHVLVLLDQGGAVHEVVARKLPAELALAEGDTVSVIRAGRRNDARYMIVHGPTSDIGWKVG